MANTNCLHGIRCPKCGFEDSFHIEGHTVFHVFDDGTEGHSDTEWGDDDGTVRCGNSDCEHVGSMHDFTRVTPHERSVMVTEIFVRCSNDPRYLEEFIDERTQGYGYHEYLAIFPEMEGEERE